VTGTTIADLRDRLSAHVGATGGALDRGSVGGQPPRVAFAFIGGPVDAAAVRDLADTQPAFREALERCQRAAGAVLGETPDGSSLFPMLEAAGDPSRRDLASLAVLIALAELWASWGVAPAGAIGDGIGQVAAACVAGALELEDGFRLAAGRAGAPAVDWRAPRIALASGSRLDEGRASLQASGVGAFLDITPQTARWTELLDAVATLFVAGVAIDWTAFDHGRDRRRVALPTYPFERERYWIDAPLPSAAPPVAAASAHPLIGVRLQSPAIRDIVFEAVLSRRTIPFVAGHRVHGEAIASAGVLIAMALEAARAAGHAAQTAVAGLALHEPLAIPDGSGRVVQIILSDGTPETTSFEIVARRLDEGSQPAWTVHASGVLKRPVAAPSSCVVRAQVEARCATEAPDALHDRLLLTGVENRAIPRAMTALRARPGEALAEVRLPKELRGDQDRYAVHPLVLDACFGVLAAARPDGIENDTYLLAAVDRAGLFGRLPESLWIHAAYRDGSSDRSAVIADLELTDDSERVVARIDGVRLARVGRQIARPETAEDDWFHQLVWRRQDLAADERETAPSPDAIVTAVGSELAALSHLHGLDRVGEYVERLDRLSTLYAVNALLDLGWRPAVPDVVTVERLMEVLQIATRHRRLVGSLLRMLEQDGVLAPAADRWTIRRAPDRDDAEREAASIASTFPEARIELTLVSQCGAALAGVLRGDVDPLTILFPGGSFDAVEPLYRDAPGARVFNALMQKVVAAAVAALPPGRTIRVLEVGAGTGSTTASVLPVLPPDRSRYVFTDVSASFTLRASERFSEYGFVDYQTLDLERSFEGQAIAGRQFDLVLATNVLHATRDLRQTLASLRGVLAPAGLLAFVEASRPHRWLDITFGLTEGWWRFEDADLRRHPLLTVPEWQAVLTATGFEGARALPGDAERGVPTSQSLVIAQAAAAPRETDVSRAPASWLVLADQRGVGDALCEQLRARGDHVQIARHGDRLDAALAAAATASHPPLAGIVHLWPIDATPFADTTADRLDADQADGSVALLDIVHALSDRSLAARIWTATCRTQAVDCGPDSAPNPSQAPVWGLARALALEHPELWGGLLDLDMADAAESARQVLAELESTDDEDQVAWRDGRRYVARLVPASRFSGQPTVIRTDASYLITGGTGGLGLRVARWLAERGARQLVLTTRRAWRDDEASDDRERAGQREAIREIERLGARVHVATADVADLAAMRQVFALFDTALPPLAGIVHAATANHSVRLRDMTADALIAMLRAKVRGTWVLDRLTADRALDFLVLFSSTTGLLGSANLGHYAAANVFLDSFAHLRRSRGLPAVSITWGAWDQMRTGESGDRVVAQAGLQRMDSTRALALMGDLLRCDMAQPVVVSADWPTLKSVYEVRRVRPLLRELGQARRAAAAPRAPEQTALLARLAEAAVEDRAEIVTTLLRDEAARVLGLPRDQVDVRRGLFEMGMDSLMSVDLKSRLQKATGLKLPTTLTFNYPTIAALCGYLLDELSPSAAASVPAAPAPVTRAATSIDPNGSTAPTEVDDLSEDELANLLAEKLAEIQ
jgi:acyl transferase domain-containing protein/aryl carrier-like protein